MPKIKKIPSLIDIADLRKIPSPKHSKWWVEDFLRVGGIGYLYGPAEVGKNLFLIDMLLHMTHSKPFLGKYKTEFASILYASYEDSIQRWKRREEDISDGYGWGPPPGDLIKILPKEKLQRMRFDLLNKKHQSWLSKILEKQDIEILILDPVLRMLPLGFDENSADEITHALFPILDHLRAEHRLTTILVDHVGWSHGHVRGSSAKFGCSDFQIKLTSPQNNRLTVQVNGNDYKQLKVTLERSEKDSGQPKHTLVPEGKSGPKKRKRKRPDSVLDALSSGCETNKEIREETGWSKTTVWRQLNKYIQQKKVRRKKGSNARYELR